jgi:KDO2-lipid IV(A) lauroyltransferase
MTRVHLRWCLAYWISRTGTALGRFLPARVWYALAIPVADICFLLARKKRRILIENLKRVVGDAAAEQAARQAFRNFGRYVIDFYQLPSLGGGALEKRLDFQNWQRLDQAVAKGNGVIFVTLHLGQHELGAAAVAGHGHRVNVIAEPLSYPPMNDFIQGLRQKLGMTIIPASGAKPGLMRALKRGEVLAMLFDALKPGEGTMVDFFGAPAEMSAAPARIALRTGASVVTTVVCRDPNDPVRITPFVDFDLDYSPTGDEERDVAALTQAIARSFESYVRQFPDQWFAFHPVWQNDKSAADDSEPEAWRLWALQAGFRLGRVLPRGVAYAIARLAGDVAFYGRRGARSDVEDNMRHVLGASTPQARISAAAREAFRNVARYYVDLIRLEQTSAAELTQKRVRMHGFDRLTDLLASGRGVIVATAHYGNPEMAVQAGAVLGLDILVLAEPLQPPAFARLMTRIRSAFGPRYVEVGYGAIAEALRHLRAGGCLAIAADRDIQDNGVLMDFFGAPTKIPLGAVELAVRTGAALMPAFCRRDGEGFDVYFEEPLELVATGNSKDDALTNTRALLQRIESWLRVDPGQWIVLERVWRPTEQMSQRDLKPASPAAAR